MGLKDSILKIEKNFAWSFLGFLLAVIFGAFSIYTVYFMDTNPKLDFVVETNTKVLDLKENVRKLDIIYKGENINENGKNLSIIKLKIINSSDVNILSTHFEIRDILGFKLEHAEIVEKPELIEYSNDDIKRNISFSLDSLGQVKFVPMMIDGGESFTLKLLALHKKSETPIIKPFGKISGIKHFSVLESYKIVQKTFWSELLEGGFWVHLVRFFGYIIFIGLTAIAIILPSVLISEWFTARKRKRNVKNYKEKKELSDTTERNLIYDIYLDFGVDYLNLVQKLLKDETRLKIQLRSYLRRKNRNIPNEYDNELQRDLNLVTGRIEYAGDPSRNIIIHDRYRIIRKLYDEKIIDLENNSLVINRQFVEDLCEFTSYLKLI